MNVRRSVSLLVPTVVATVGLISAQEPTTLVIEGQAIAGVGAVTRIDTLALNDAGDWLVEVDTDHSDTTQDSALMRNGALHLREGQALPAPAGASIGSFDAITLNAAGDSAWNFFLDGTGSSSTDSGVFWNTQLLVQEGDVSSAPQFSAGTGYIGFFEARPNDAGQVLVIASVDDPAISSTVDRALVILTVDGAGTLLSESVFAKEGDILAGVTDAVSDFGTSPHTFGINDAGDLLFVVKLTGSSATDGAVYLNSTLLAREGSPSPVAGRNWSSLTSAEVGLSSAGDYVISGSLDGASATNLLIERNGAKFMQEGDSPAAITPFLLTSFGSGPVLVASSGSVLWYGDWNDPDTSRDTGLFIDDTLVIQEGVTTIGGVAVKTLRGVQDGYALAPNGSSFVFEAELANGLDGAFLVQLGSITPLVGCGGNAGTLVAGSGVPAVGASFDLLLDLAQGPGVAGFLAIATQPVPAPPPCGITVPGMGELLIDILPPNPFLYVPGGIFTGTALTVPLAIPPDPALNGIDFYTQGAFVDAGALYPSEPIRFSNAVVLSVGA